MRVRPANWIVGLLAALVVSGLSRAQLATRDGSGQAAQAEAAHRTRLILKDGSYQVVMSYKIVGTTVRYVSAERGGEVEEIPLDLVDLAATKKWEQRHAAQAEAGSDGSREKDRAPVLDPELAKEEADRAAVTPEVEPNLRLVAENAVMALDYWEGTPELVPLQQTAGDLNRQTGHSILRGVMNPNASQHQVVQLKGEKAAVQMHVNQPEFFLHLDDSTGVSGEVLTVNTQGLSAADAVKEKQSGSSRYAIVRVSVRQDARVVASFDTSGRESGRGRRSEELIPTTMTTLPGGHWAKVVPTEPMLFGEYCLVEILAENQINLSVWDFGVHPTAPENRDVVKPELRKPRRLERRTGEP